MIHIQTHCSNISFSKITNQNCFEQRRFITKIPDYGTGQLPFIHTGKINLHDTYLTTRRHVLRIIRFAFLTKPVFHGNSTGGRSRLNGKTMADIMDELPRELLTLDDAHKKVTEEVLFIINPLSFQYRQGRNPEQRNRGFTAFDSQITDILICVHHEIPIRIHQVKGPQDTTGVRQEPYNMERHIRDGRTVVRQDTGTDRRKRIADTIVMDRIHGNGTGQGIKHIPVKFLEPFTPKDHGQVSKITAVIIIVIQKVIQSRRILKSVFPADRAASVPIDVHPFPGINDTATHIERIRIAVTGNQRTTGGLGALHATDTGLGHQTEHLPIPGDTTVSHRPVQFTGVPCGKEPIVVQKVLPFYGKHKIRIFLIRIKRNFKVF